MRNSHTTSELPPVAAPRREGKRRPATHVKIIPYPQDMDIFDRQEMQKQRPLVKNKLNEWYDWLVHHVPKTVESKVSNAFKAFKERIAGLWGKVSGKETLKDIVEEEAEKQHKKDQEEEEQQENIDLTPQEHEQALNGAYRSFQSPGLPKTDVDTYIKKITPHMKTLIEQQIKDLGSAKVQLCMWIKWKKTEEMVIQLTPEEFEEAEDIPGEVKEIIVEKAFNSKMMEIFQGSNIEEILEKMFAYIKDTN